MYMDVFSLSISFGYFDGHMSLILKQLPNIVLFLVHYLSQNMTYHWNFNMYNMMGATSRAGIVYLSGAPDFTPIFSRFLLLNLSYSVQCYVDHCLSFCSPFCHCIFCLSIYVFSLPLSYLKTFLAVISNINSRCYWRLHFTSSNL